MTRPRGLPARAWEAVPSYRPGSDTIANAPPSLRISCARDAWQATRDIHEAHQEHLIVFDLNVRHKIMVRRVMAIGSSTGVEVHPREVFRQAIANGAVAVLLVHNHPSGDHTPSRQDLDLTARLREVGEICGIPLLDHVVVSCNGFQSISEMTA